MKKIALIVALALGLIGPALAQSTSPPLNISGGKGSGGSSGTVTSVGSGAGLTGGPCTTTCTLSATYVVNAQTGTSYTVLSTDASKLVTFSNGSAIAVTLPQATGSFAAGFSFDTQNLGAGLVTITPTTSTINGAATLTIPTNTGCSIVSDGTNYQVSACAPASGITGTGSFVRATSPTLVTPTLGAATATTVNGVTIPSTTDTAALLGTAQNWTAEQRNCVTTLSINSSTHFTPDGSCNNYIIVLTSACASAACTLDNFSTTRQGASGWVKVVQPASGGPAAFGTYGSQLMSPGGTSTITYSTAANAIDLWSYANLDTTHTAIVPGGLAFAH